MKIKKILMALMCVLVLTGTCMADTVILSIHNCDEGTWVGGVRWNADKTDYIDIPEIELKHAGWLDVKVEPGTYAFTHFRPARIVTDQNGNTVVLSVPAILNYVDDVVIKEKTITVIEFGTCK
jgi:hypothetical protein